MKVLVLGGNGMAGHMIAAYLSEQGNCVDVFARKENDFCYTIIGDACDDELLRNVLSQTLYDVVINCIGILNDAANLHIAQAIYLNSYLPHRLADLLSTSHTKLIHISTDCVFSGYTGPYTEQSPTDGTSWYDRTKALGEVIDDKNLTFRMSIIGPDRNENGIGLFHWFMKQKSQIKGYTNAIWTGVTTLTLAKAIQQAIEEDLCGLYHLVNHHSISKYELCQLFNRTFRNDSILVEPYHPFVLDKTLMNTRTDFSFQVPSYEVMIDEMKEWIVNHSAWYSYDI